MTNSLAQNMAAALTVGEVVEGVLTVKSAQSSVGTAVAIGYAQGLALALSKPALAPVLYDAIIAFLGNPERSSKQDTISTITEVMFNNFLKAAEKTVAEDPDLAAQAEAELFAR